MSRGWSCWRERQERPEQEKRAEEESTGRREEVRNKGATSTGCWTKSLVPTSQEAPRAQETAEHLPSQRRLPPPATGERWRSAGPVPHQAEGTNLPTGHGAEGLLYRKARVF